MCARRPTCNSYPFVPQRGKGWGWFSRKILKRYTFAGAGPIIRSSAHIAASQREPFPVFLKRGNKQFEFIGNFRGVGIDESPNALQQANHRSNRTDVTAILVLERLD